jgi:hypothetical protein
MNSGGYLPELGQGGTMGYAGGNRGVEQAYREGLRDLSEVRRDLRDNPEIAKEVQDLIREMQRLDPSRFKGNPALVEQLRSQVLTGLEQLELQMRRKLESSTDGQVRSSTSQPVPTGYQESVAEYFRRLSRGK